jgi:adenosylcobinamide-GDP ribazoletransferase
LPGGKPFCDGLEAPEAAGWFRQHGVARPHGGDRGLVGARHRGDERANIVERQGSGFLVHEGAFAVAAVVALNRLLGRLATFWQCGAMSASVPRPRFRVTLAQALRFYSRLPVPRLPDETLAEGVFDFPMIAPAVPAAGALIGLVMAVTLLVAHGLGLGPMVAAILVVTCGVLVTGALHEDGLADTADGFFAQASIERRLQIMRDARLGSFGVLALVAVMLLRVGLIADLALDGPRAAAAALIAAAALSRAAGLMPLALLYPARRDGAGATAGRLPVPAFTNAVLIGCGITLVLALAGGFGALRALGACVAALVAARGVCAIAEQKIGGQTGDVAGAAQILAELACYLVLAMG